MGRRGAAVALIVAPVAVFVVLGLVDPAGTRGLVYEEGPIEWLEVVFCVVAAALALARARTLARSGDAGAAFHVVIAALLVVLALGELELDRLFFGTKLIGPRFFLSPRRHVAWPWRVLAALIAVGGPVAIGVYALTRIRRIVGTGFAALRETWGRVLFFAFLLFGLVQVFERPLNRLHFVNEIFVEEGLELVAAGGFVAAYLLYGGRKR